MKEALHYFLNEEQVCNGTEDPDEGIDYIFMLDLEEWEETGSTSIALSEQEKKTILEKLEKTSDHFREFPEYNELATLLTDG